MSDDFRKINKWNTGESHSELVEVASKVNCGHHEEEWDEDKKNEES